ncbi:MAG: prepilin-type N-terminal cleavage/methylation domain-containing protein [Tissierella sp.]|nr:prepilin-type N-terminal cleavage/methylation domain-containing protein [Tissierella sp.]
MKNRKGLTLIEVILSLAILGMITIPLLNMFVFSTVTNSKSEDVLDATYIAQQIMEERYNESKNGEEIPLNNEYLDSSGVYWIEEKVSNEGNLVRVLIKVYTDNSKKELKAQMETSLLWD